MRRAVSIFLPLSILLAAACSSASSTPEKVHLAQGSSRAAAVSFTPWWTYHRTPDRAGHAIGPVGGPLKHAWSKKLGAAVYGEPLVVGTTLIVATERNQVFGLNASTGHVRWRTGLGKPQPLSGLPCGDINPTGITSTPVYDPRTGSVFVVAETRGAHHTLWALKADNGKRRWHRSLDVLTHRNRHAEQQRASLLVAHGHVLASFGARAGDCGNYVGYITSTPTSGTGAVHHYAVPTRRGAGMWSPAGPALGVSGNAYVATANGAAVGKKWDRSNGVLELTPGRLKVASAFAPSTWRHDSLDDQGLGSTSPVSVPSLHRLVVGSKRARVYLLREHLGGIGSAVAQIDGCSTFGGPALSGHTMVMPCLFEHRIRALRVGKSSLHWAWTARGLYGSPVIAGQRVYVSDRDTGDLFVLRLDNGHRVQRIHAGNLTHFPSQVVDGGFVFVPTLSGITAFHG
jgi:outer membrane protein assembly factor BamB